ncbi:MAG: alpha-galactosidase [Lachnospiraceae bacterium]|nr:alpha-galactosidase [Lachnospiraceae bacterium]
MKRRKKTGMWLMGMLLAAVMLGGCGAGEDEDAVSAPENIAGAGGDEADPEQQDAQEDSANLWEDRVLYEKGLLLAEQKDNRWILTNGSVSVEYDIAEGTYQVLYAGTEEPLLSEVCAKTVLKDGTELLSRDMRRLTEDCITVEEITDGFGQGIRVQIANTGTDVVLTQVFDFYEELPYFLCEAEVSTEAEPGISTNYIAPVFASKGDFKTNILSVEGEDVRFLFTPYDNDAFVRYSSDPLLVANESYEVTAVFDNVTRKGLIAGSVSHDTWKTGIKVRQGGMNATVEFSVFGGANSAYTRDAVPHGYVSGSRVTSPKIFLGYYEDYREGLESFGRANAVIAPPLAWDRGIPIGWNSWSAVADKVSYAVYTDSSNFVKNNLQDNSFSQDGVVYINFDSFWDNLTEKELKEAAQHVRDNGQIPGIYMTPFTFWGGSYNAGWAPGTGDQYTWKEILLKDADGNILPAVDGGISIDPTHPGTIMNLEYQLNRFKEWGFAYVKMDFMSHGAREGAFYNQDITTGTQAYNYGMQKIHEMLAEELENQEFFISFSIAPMFPSQYAHSRRISCDVFGTIDNTEYMLNSLTYGWWMNGTIYPFNDPDHIVLYNSFNHKDAILYNEGLSRYISGAIAGTLLIDSDDFRIKEARNRAVEMLTCEEINAVAKRGISFRPVEGNTKNAACDTFVSWDEEEDVLYLAVFNFSSTETKTVQVDLERIGLDPSGEYEMYDLWSKETVRIKDGYEMELDKAEPKLFRITK